MDATSSSGTSKVLAWKAPARQLSDAPRLHVGESLMAFLIAGETAVGPFGAGSHTISDEQLAAIAQAGQRNAADHTTVADVWYVCNDVALESEWRTPVPIRFSLRESGETMRVRCHGKYGVRLADAARFLLAFGRRHLIIDEESMASTVSSILHAPIVEYTGRRTTVPLASYFAMTTALKEMEAGLRGATGRALEEFGFSLTFFDIRTATLGDGHPAVLHLTDEPDQQTK